MKRNKKDSFYFLIKDILSCFPDKTEGNLIVALNSHLISKKVIRQILKDEIQEKNPQFRIIAGALILQNNFLRKLPSSAFYEVMDIMSELKYCFEIDKRKTIKLLSSQAILRLFASLYFEFIILPLGYRDRKIYLDKFKKYFSKKDMLNVIKINGFYTLFIFRDHGIELGTSKKANSKLKAILNKFY